MDRTQATRAASLVTDATTGMNGGADMNDGVAYAVDVADASNATVIVIDPNTWQQNHTEMNCVPTPRGVVSAAPEDVVGIVASATRTYTLSDGTPAAVKHVRLAGAATMAAVVSTGPMATGDVPVDVPPECCMSVPMETSDVAADVSEVDAVADGDDTVVAASLEEEVMYQEPLAELWLWKS